ncbi:SAC3/GANP/Nin1/mts3/eIF-3 p25 family-domain-containing protein [Jimgerdemannia flammicorona]|uniref:SAC3/GANP/Nin1/mts3/eIF-3 p25 family-domain-containing protein n=1 Tax=Jimgerdemannia flammicorona TaxID=994334 RepID=A0A433D1P0_9FUNG|nr:SAC3/GANP/Nin1/mts3/eIF-3 p25 family-domain-containing protein [Jimgerdemannia flammicorona]
MPIVEATQQTDKGTDAQYAQQAWSYPYTTDQTQYAPGTIAAAAYYYPPNAQYAQQPYSYTSYSGYYQQPADPSYVEAPPGVDTYPPGVPPPPGVAQPPASQTTITATAGAAPTPTPQNPYDSSTATTWYQTTPQPTYQQYGYQNTSYSAVNPSYYSSQAYPQQTYSYSTTPTVVAPYTGYSSAPSTAPQTQTYSSFYQPQPQPLPPPTVDTTAPAPLPPPTLNIPTSAPSYSQPQDTKPTVSVEAMKAGPSQAKNDPAPDVGDKLHQLNISAPSKPAYTAVKSKKIKNKQAQSKLAPAEAKNNTPVEEATKSELSTDNWPQSLKDYVTAVFDSCDREKIDVVEVALRDLIMKTHQKGQLWTTDWENKELPSACDPLKLKQGSKRWGKRKKLDDDDSSSSAPEISRLRLEKIEDKSRLEKRLKRFQAQDTKVTKSESPAPIPVYNSDVIDWDEYTIVGTSTLLEKRYLRLTSAPDPATVRPPEVLKKTLSLLKKKWQEEQNYSYICDQFKSMRQDLTVYTPIISLSAVFDFLVIIMEGYLIHLYHCLTALPPFLKGDLGEYNQCQTQLKQLYAYNLPGNVIEFTAYRILYLLHTRNRSDINGMMAELTEEQKGDPVIAHALNVRSALATSNYHKFFKLYNEAPNMGGYLMDQFVERERVEALKTMCKAYRPNLPLDFVRGELAFGEMEECVKFLSTHKGAYFDPTRTLLDTKTAYPGLVESGRKYGKIDIKGQI